ncbi:MAG: hypothetical protein ACHQJ6_00300 [Candidatus Berkiellales bacterium]
MSKALEQRIKNFTTQAVAKELVKLKHPSYASDYRRLVLSRRAIEVIFSILLIYGGQQFLIQQAFFCPIWPASGVGLCAIFIRGPFLILGVFLGSLASYLYYHLAWFFSIILSLLFAVTLFLIRECSLRWIGAVTPIATRAILLKFIFLIGVFSLFHVILHHLALEWATGLSFKWINVVWGALGEINGILCLTPFCLIFEPFVPQRYFQLKLTPWKIIAVLIITSYLLFYFIPNGFYSYILAILLLIGLGIYAKCFGQIPTCVTLLGISIVYFTAVLSPSHLFTLHSSKVEVLMLTALFTLTVISSLTIATPQKIVPKLIPD